MLVIAYNQALMDRNKNKVELIEQDNSIIEDNERMDIIGQNGNDGLHYDLIDDEDVEELPEPREENDPSPQPSKEPTARGGVKTK